MFNREEWLARAMRSPHVTASRKLIRALKDHGDPVVAVFNGDETEQMTIEREILETVANLDTCQLILESGATILVVGGNESELDCIADWSAKDDAGLNAMQIIIDDAKLKDDE